jgi:hypothetical protein
MQLLLDFISLFPLTYLLHVRGAGSHEKAYGWQECVISH